MKEATTANDDKYQFLLACLKHTKEKPDFAAVATELHLKNYRVAYKRHWAIMNKAGVAGYGDKGLKAGEKVKDKAKEDNLDAGDDDAEVPTPDSRNIAGLKRGRVLKPTTPPKFGKYEEEEDDDMEEEESGPETVETPSKKPKEKEF